MTETFRNIWLYRYFIFTSVKNEMKLRFVRSKLGGLWMVLHPLAQVLMFTFVLSAVLSTRLPGIDSRYAYANYLLAGMLGWSLFLEIVTRCTTLFIDNANSIKKLFFPKFALPLIVAGSALINNMLLLSAVLVILALLGHLPGAAFIWLPVLTLINMMLALGMGLIIGTLNVFIRDVGQVIPIAMQFLFWLTPVVYMLHILPVRYQHILTLNPLVPLIEGYHEVLLYNRAPHMQGLWVIALTALITISFSLLLLRRAGPEIVDQL